MREKSLSIAASASLRGRRYSPSREVCAIAGSINYCRTLDSTQLRTESLPRSRAKIARPPMDDPVPVLREARAVYCSQISNVASPGTMC